MSRFKDSDEVDVNNLKAVSRCKNTDKSTNSWVNSYEEWRKSRNITEKLEETEPEILKPRLELFYAKLRKEDGSKEALCFV